MGRMSSRRAVFLIVASTAGLLLLGTVGEEEAQAARSYPHKTAVCHIPPGNPANAKTLYVGGQAPAAHLAHGDFLGECGCVDRNAGPDFCDDHNLCTNDSCNRSNGLCENVPVDCEDGDLCTVDSCNVANGQCESVPVVCNDNNACTDDACNPSNGVCDFTAVVGRACDDNDLCTESDACTAEATCQGSPVVCDDGNACTDDACDTAVGCVAQVVEGRSCDDNSLCTDNDVCMASGTCRGTETGDCCLGDEDCDAGAICCKSIFFEGICVF
jgi:hypothetical protein